MKITTDELIDLLDEMGTAIGEIIATHSELSESLLSIRNDARTRQRIDALKAKIDAEREKLKISKDRESRAKELERIRRDHEKEGRETQEEGRSIVSVVDKGGKVVGWVKDMGRGVKLVLNAKGRVVGRETDRFTTDGNGRVIGYGRQGLRALGRCKN